MADGCRRTVNGGESVPASAIRPRYVDGMRAVVLSRHGGPEVLRIADVPTPEPRANEARVRIQTIGINFAEVLSRRGLYGWAPRLPYVPG